MGAEGGGHNEEDQDPQGGFGTSDDVGGFVRHFLLTAGASQVPVVGWAVSVRPAAGRL
jgi:hypothetical protein